MLYLSEQQLSKFIESARQIYTELTLSCWTSSHDHFIKLGLLPFKSKTLKLTENQICSLDIFDHSSYKSSAQIIRSINRRIPTH